MRIPAKPISFKNRKQDIQELHHHLNVFQEWRLGPLIVKKILTVTPMAAW
jgi:hypothetical protein